MNPKPMDQIELQLAIKFLRYRASVGPSVVISKDFAESLANHLEADLTPTAERKSA